MVWLWAKEAVANARWAVTTANSIVSMRADPSVNTGSMCWSVVLVMACTGAILAFIDVDDEVQSCLPM